MIKVTDDYIIQVDDLNYVVCQNKPYKTLDKKGNEVTRYPGIGYCSSLENAILLIRGKTIRDELQNGEYSLAEAVVKVQKITADFQKILTEAMNGGTGK